MYPSKGLSDEARRMLLDTVQELHGQGRYRSAMDRISEVLAEVPDDDFVFQLANLVLHTGLARENAYSSPEPLTNEYIADTRFDALFCECNICYATWVINPMLAMALEASVLSSKGGICPRCKTVYCRNCASKQYLSQSVGSPATFVCSKCNVELEILKKPNGRQPRQTQRKSKPIKQIIFLREGPVQPTIEYLNKIFRLISPEIFDDHPNIFAAPLEVWPATTRDLTSFLYAIALQKGCSLDDIQTFFFTPDEYGNRFCLAKIY